MLSLSVTFLLIALIAAAIAYSGLAGTSVVIIKLLFWFFLILFVITLTYPIVMERRPPAPPV